MDMQKPGYELLRWGEEALRNAQITDWKTDAWILYEFVTGQNRAAFLMEARHTVVSDYDAERYEELIERRCCHVPVQHLTGVQEFMGFSFRVNENVLVPRMDTEVLVQEVEKYAKPGASVLDMCTGSGCIAISLKKRNDRLKLSAADCSGKALEIARDNCQRLNAEVRLYCSDLFEQFKQTEQLEQFDMIVSNPPYIPSRVVDTLAPEVRKHEPRLALDGAGDGLFFYRRITADSTAFLKKGGMLFYEIGYDQGAAVQGIMEESGFRNVKIIKDLAGLDRVVYGGIEDV